MPKSANQKGKLLLLQRVLLEQTDEEHGLTAPELIELLGKEGIHAERKSLYSDLETLSEQGMDILSRREGGKVYYYVGSRAFELPELKLLVDAVQASRFITRKKSTQLIRKVEGLASRYQAQALQRQVFVANRVKTENESIYYNVDKLYAAIADNRRVEFHYLEWGFRDGTSSLPVRQRRREGKLYCVSPWALSWADDNYYLIGYDSESDSVRHYRVDKMEGIAETELARDGEKAFADFDMAVYTRRVFGMFGGDEETVTLRFDNGLLGVVIDRFGESASIRRENEREFVVRARVVVSTQFLSWVFGFEGRAQIVAPASVAERFRRQARAVLGEKDPTPRE